MKTDEGKGAVRSEGKKMKEMTVWDPPVERPSVENDAVVVRTKLLISIKHMEEQRSKWVWKARFVALGNPLYDKWMRPRPYLRAGEYWVPVASLGGARFVQLRACAHRRLAETIGLITAYLQIFLGGYVPHYIMLEASVLDILLDGDAKEFRGLKEPVSRLQRALYGLGRAGLGFSIRLASWLLLNGWTGIPDEPALLYWCVQEKESEIMKRAINIKVVMESERRNKNKDVLELVHTQKDSDRGSRNLVTKWERYSSGPEGALLGHLVEAALLGTYVDDCELDAPPKIRQLVWRVISLFFYATEPEEVAKFIGLRPLLVCKHGKGFMVALSQSDHVDNMVEVFEADRGRKVRECWTVGQAGACPNIKTMERKPGGVRANGPIGSSM